MKVGGKAKRELKGSKQKKSRKNLSRLLASAKGYCVCGRDHRARQALSPKEILNAIEPIKSDNPTVLFSVDEVIVMKYVMASTIESKDDDHNEQPETDLDDANFVSAMSNNGYAKTAQSHFGNVAFVHGRTFATDL